MASVLYKDMCRGIRRLERTFLPFGPRPEGDYTARQLSLAAAFTVFCHAEFEAFLESWAQKFVDLAESEWAKKRATRPLVHICTFHEGRGVLSTMPNKDVWSEVIWKALAKMKGIISSNHGIREANVCELFSPLGFNVSEIDEILIADLTAFSKLRGQHAHNAQKSILGTTFDPFDRKAKVDGIKMLLEGFDEQLLTYFESC